MGGWQAIRWWIIRQKVIAVWTLTHTQTQREREKEREREREREAEKEPIMLCRIADRGLLFGYFANKMLSLYEDWREERDSFFIPWQQKPILILIYIYIYIYDDDERRKDKYEEG